MGVIRRAHVIRLLAGRAASQEVPQCCVRVGMGDRSQSKRDEHWSGLGGDVPSRHLRLARSCTLSAVARRVQGRAACSHRHCSTAGQCGHHHDRRLGPDADEGRAARRAAARRAALRSSAAAANDDIGRGVRVDGAHLMKRSSSMSDDGQDR